MRAATFSFTAPPVSIVTRLLSNEPP